MINNEKYGKMAKKASPNSKWFKNLILAFLVGGAICTLGQVFLFLYGDLCEMETKDAGMLTSASLIAIAALLTGFGVFDNIAKYAGAGTLVPITGFANAMVSPALEFRTEGLVLGLAAKMFIIAGPVIVYGIVVSALYGVIYFLLT